MSLVATLTQPLRNRYEAMTLDKNEVRRSRYGALDFFQEQTKRPNSILTRTVTENIKKSMGNTVQVPVLDAGNVVITNQRTCTVPDNENTSKLVTLTFVTYAYGFTMIPSQYNNNDVGYRDDFDRKMEEFLIKFADTLDTAAVNTLNVNRNQYFPASITSYYPNIGNSLQVSDEEKADFYNNLQSIHNTMDYYGNINIVTSTSGMPNIRRLQAQGTSNGINESFQFDPYTWYGTNRLLNGAGVKSTQFSIPDGYVAMQNRNDPDSIANRKTGDGHEWAQVYLPLVNLNVGSMYYSNCADKSALHAGTAHLTGTAVEGYLFSTDVVFMTAYNSNPAGRFGPILKAEIANAVPTT